MGTTRSKRLITAFFSLFFVMTILMGNYAILDVQAATYASISDWFGISRSEFVNYLKSHENDSYYKGTPYYGIDAYYPNGDPGAYCGGSVKMRKHTQSTNAWMNCTGFVWHAILSARTYAGKTDYTPSEFAKWVPRLQTTEPVYQWVCPGNVYHNSWTGFRAYYEMGNCRPFDSKKAMLSANYLEKGDIIWAYGNGDGGHLMIFWGNSPSEDKAWQSHPNLNNGVGKIMNKDGSENGQYLVFKWGPEKGKVKLVKVSTCESVTENNPCYSLEGAVYGVFSDNSCNVSVGTLTTDKTGETNTIELKAGTYWIKEITAPKGYALDVNPHKITVTGDKVTTFEAEDVPMGDPASILIRKIDSDTGKAVAAGGADLSGAEYTYKYYPVSMEEYRSLEKEQADELAAEKTWVFRTDSYGTVPLSADISEYLVSGELYTDAYGTQFFPAGTYTIQETTAPEGYLIDENIYRIFIVMQDDGTIKRIDDEGNPTSVIESDQVSTFPEQVIRGDLSLKKVDADTGEIMAGITFRVTSKTTGEMHELVTGTDGTFDSSKDEFFWFGSDSKTIGAGALPFDTYTIEEIRDEKNAGKAMYFGEFTINENKQEVDLGTINNKDITLKTTATEEKTGLHEVGPAGDITIRDIVAYTGLTPGKEYTVIGTLTDKKTGEVIKDSENKEYTTTVKFTPDSVDGTVEVDFSFDSVSLAGKTTVVFEELYDDDILVACHKDLNDSEQTVKVLNPDIRTSAHDSQTLNNNALPCDSSELIDTVDYNLYPGQEYIIKTTLMDKETEKPLCDIDDIPCYKETAFVPENVKGSIDIRMNVDTGSLSGKNLVFFEEIVIRENADPETDKIIAEHKDINDRGQTIVITPVEIGTSAKNDSDGSRFLDRNAIVKLIDTVTLNNLIKGREYTLVGTLIVKETGKPFLSDGKENTSVLTFTAEEAKMSVDMPFKVDTKNISGKSLVVFERLYESKNGVYDENIAAASHEDITDSGQTVTVKGTLDVELTGKDGRGSGLKTGDKTLVVISSLLFIVFGCGYGFYRLKQNKRKS